MLLAASASAQVNRCEVGGRVVYQDQPCAGRGGALEKPQPVEKVDPSYEGPGKALCLADAPRHFKDPDSLKIGIVFYSGIFPSPQGTSRRYTLAINGKNSYGGYAGEKFYHCYVSLDESRLHSFGQ
ncbi:DUF4124 domain-containing protein [Cupriavidus necator]|uniref:DUF4124 domain-containing protein n=1 Tax=Cupriavidus necator TaxID=106590 RepID=UPI000A7489AC|nr:DUF4124 domain-containing protein [Cupriavidus necator]